MRGMDDVIPVKASVPVVALKPGFVSAATDTVIDETDMAPTVTAGVEPVTAASITKPAAVWVLTLNVDAA